MKKVVMLVRESRHLRVIILVLLYALVLLLSRLLAFGVRFDFDVSKTSEWIDRFQDGCWWIILLQVAALILFGQTGGILRYFSLPDFGKIAMAMFCSSVVVFLARLYLPPKLDPRGVILLNMIFSIGVLTLVRLGIRMYWEKNLSEEANMKRVRVGIIGAGDVGAKLAQELLSRPNLGMTPVVFFDDDQAKWNLTVHGIPVAGSPNGIAKYVPRLQLEKVVFAMPTASASRIGEIVKLCNHIKLPHETVPSMYQLASGQVSVSRLRPVDIEDLLGRDMVQLNAANLREMVQGKVVAVTGAGGSIGSELCRQIAALNPQRLVLIEQSEPSMFVIEQELISLGHGAIISPKIADVVDTERMRNVFERFRPSIIFHAAAHKHVPLMESQPGEAIKNNTFGTAYVAHLALEYNVERFVLISTDKAINPTNVMGAT